MIGRRLRGKVEPGRLTAHELGQFAMHHADQRLAGSERADHLLPHRLFLDAGDEVLDHRQRDIGLQQRHAHLAQHVGDVVLGQARLAAQGLDDAAEPLGQVVEHDDGIE